MLDFIQRVVKKLATTIVQSNTNTNSNSNTIFIKSFIFYFGYF